jgi:hypothetical protein
MRKIVFILLGAALLLGLSTCLDEIEIELPNRPEDGYVVQAKLIKGTPSLAEVRVERAFQYTSNINQAVSDAEVRLVKENGFSLTFASNQLNGVYTQVLDQQNFPINTGDRFRIEVMIADSILIHSAWEGIHDTPQAQSLEWKWSETETISPSGLVNRVPAITFGITTPTNVTNGESARLRWELLDAYRISDNVGQVCYIENRYQSAAVFLLDGTTVAQDSVQDYPLFTAPRGIRHIEGYYLTAYQQSLSPTAFNYWQEVASLLEREGTVFDNPAGRISTNFSDQLDANRNVYGFFSAYGQDTVRLFISREDTGQLPAYCPRPPNSQPNPAPTVCDNCIANGFNASLNKPYYWEE